ncbi:MAG: hypothetical protein PVI23_16780, partial [Maricaulaceae bacterium]
MNRRRVLKGFAALAGAGGLASCAGAGVTRGQGENLQVATTSNQIVINGAPVDYRAVVAETLLPATETRPAAVAITNAYIREGVANRSTRPILFAFNGGPGASSSPLHFDALGPRVFVREPGQPARIANNSRSPLDAMDLVFIDPVGTGYTRILDGEDGGALWSVLGDGEAAAEIIDAWLTEHDRHDSPRF